ncbi:DUF2637 domain-containing protein [Streptomyces tirandamycinicus]|nr:DUF2637 domain-containing protein [Streptomyces tirandamycinicus]
MSEAEIRSAERTLKNGTWAITAGALLFSVLTVTPLVRSVSPAGWEWTAPILPLVVDAAVIIVVKLDSVVSRLGSTGGAWPALLRWMTGMMTLALNVGHSALHGDWVGVAVHSVAPLLLIVTAEAGLAYRRAISSALDRIAAEEAAAEARRQTEREAKEQRLREERERERAAREQAAREEREHAEQIERERQEREDARLRAEREHALTVERERAEREAQQEKERAEREERIERQRAERAAAERRHQEERERKERIERERQDRAERQRREQELAAQTSAAAAAPAPARQPVSAKAHTRPPRVVQPVVMENEFAGMTQAEAEAALFELYRAARDASTYPEWEQDPLAQPGGEFCGSRLGVRLGRSDASGRAKVKPKFERWYAEHLEKKAEERELVGVG